MSQDETRAVDSPMPGLSAEPSLFELFDILEAREVKAGKIVAGTVGAADDSGIEVTIAEKVRGRIASDDFGSAWPTHGLNSGDAVEVYVESYDDDGVAILSLDKVSRLKLWDALHTAQSQNEPLPATVLARARGGLAVDIGVKAFLPASEIDTTPVPSLDALIGQTFDVRILRIHERKNQIVVSRSALMPKVEDVARVERTGELVEGEVVRGRVKNLTRYGAFVDLGGIDGLLHVSDMSWRRVNRPEEVLKAGEDIEVKIISIDAEKNRIKLGMKQLRADPWVDVASRYAVGTRVEGKVTSLTDYGAFVQLEDGIEGLVHLSEMSWTKRVRRASDAASIGEPVEAVVLRVDPEERRLGLSLKQATPSPWDQLRETYPIGTRIVGKMHSVTDFGIFVGVGEGIDGLVHTSDISWKQDFGHPRNLYSVGDEAEALVLNIDADRQRMSLGVKQLVADETRPLYDKYSVGQILDGKVTRVVPYGAFVELEPGIEGLAHISELSDARVEKAGDVVSDGQTVQVRVLSVDVDTRRIGLSMKGFGRSPADEAPADDDKVEETPVDQVATSEAAAASTEEAAPLADQAAASVTDDAPADPVDQ